MQVPHSFPAAQGYRNRFDDAEITAAESVGTGSSLDLADPEGDDEEADVGGTQRMTSDGLHERVAQVLGPAREQLARSDNTVIVQVNWLNGRAIMEVEQAGEHRATRPGPCQAGFGQGKSAFGLGLNALNLWNIRWLVQVFRNHSALAAIPQAASAESSRGIPRTPSGRSLGNARARRRVRAPVDGPGGADGGGAP